MAGGTSSDRGLRVLVLAVYPGAIASTRLRALQFAPYLTGVEGTLTVWSFLRDGDIPTWFEGKRRHLLRLVLLGLCRLTLLPRLVRTASVVIVQREVVPFGPPVVETLVARHRPVVWDVDDAVWEDYPGLFGTLPNWVRKTARKYERLCQMATEVWAGSETLAHWCRQHSADVVTIPTVVEVPAEVPDVRHDRTLGWIGSPSTGPYLERVLPAIDAVRPAPTVMVVGAAVDAAGAARVEQHPWSGETERSALETMTVGLYPVDESHPLAHGKCALKAIMYMAWGIPQVVTPTPVNASVVRDNVEGLHAGAPAEWTDAVQRLLDDPALRSRMATAARLRAERYSLQRWGPTVAARLFSIAESRP